MMAETFLELLYEDAPPAAYDELCDRLRERLGDAAAEQHALALQVRERVARHRGREAELSALYDTAGDLTAIRDLDTILGAIVRRARQLLHADMTYLSLNDEAEGASYMKVTDGALTPEFRELRLPLGTGLLGLVAQAGAPYFTEDYQVDERFVHREYIDSAVAGERIRAILGVPLVVDGHVIGALLAVHRTVRPFPPGEVTLLTSFAAHAAVALENARLFEQARAAVDAADEANALLRSRSEQVEGAARAHDRLTDVLLHGGGVAEIAEVLAGVLGGQVTVYDEAQRLLAGEPEDVPGLDAAVEQALRSGRSVELAPGTYVAVAAAGEGHLGTLLVRTGPLEQGERRTLERGAIVTALVLLFARTEAEAEERVRGELLVDLLAGRELDRERLRERARRQGAEVEKPGVLAVARVAGADLHRAARMAGRLARERHGLAAAHEGHVVLLVPGDEALEVGEALRARVGAEPDRVTVGVVAVPGSDGVPAGHAEARRCVDTLLALGRDGEVSDPPHLGLARLLLGSSGREELDDFVDAVLGPVLAYDAGRGAELADTLAAWFSAGGSLRSAAAALHVHPNTVSQRLERVGSLLGAGWREPDRALDVQLALRLHCLRA
ncbi:helix-turn-helix domain-containing protein [Nocardioides sp. MJB4]|uniref:Helix-turn-helix domain-containing protein n=1 Tax=Nocardioides donggukensis TaxID=2774019 RepID=A0A927K2E2_9ACTN|nr:helix-turn-helix domain-containing protein [Nocardioides donggukensis]